MRANQTDYSGQFRANEKDEHTAEGHTAINRGQGIASTRTRGYRLRIDENLNHSPWLIPPTQTGGVDRTISCHRPEVLRERPRS